MDNTEICLVLSKYTDLDTVFMFQMLSWVLATLLLLSFYTASHKCE